VQLHGASAWQSVWLEQLVKVADAVKTLIAVEGDLVLAARGLEVDQKELAAAMAQPPAPPPPPAEE